jgi:tetratricopeptide (TPR) repeat protein
VFPLGIYLTAGKAAQRSARFEDAAAYFQHAIELGERSLKEPILDRTSALDLVGAYHGAGDTLGAQDRFSLGRARDAEPYFRHALTLCERLAASDPDDATARLEVARSAGKLGSVLDKTHPAEALLLYQRVRNIADESLPQGPARQAMQAAADSSIAMPLARLGRIDEARRHLQSALSIFQQGNEATPGRFSALTDLSDVWFSFGQVEMPRQPGLAISHFRKALAFAAEASKLAMRDFSVAFREVNAMESLAAALKSAKGNAADAEIRALRRALVETWSKWDALLPGSPFIQSKLRSAQAAADSA